MSRPLENLIKLDFWFTLALAVSLVILLIIPILSYFELKKIEFQFTTFPSVKFGREKSESEIPLATPAPDSDLILPEAPSFEPKEEEEISPVSEKIVHLPILMYHHINYLPVDASKIYQDLTVSPETFEKQMKYLFEEDYYPITFNELINYLNDEKELPEKSLIITFDDGWKNQYRYALPVLKKYNFRATFFIVVNYIGGGAFMDLADLKELLDSGMEIGSHSMNHPNLCGLSDSYLRYEIQNSKIILEKGLDSPINPVRDSEDRDKPKKQHISNGVNVFAYPYCAYSSRVIKVVQESGYFFARTCGGGTYQDLEKPYSLGAIQVYDNLYQLKRIFP